MSSKEIKALERRFVEELNKGKTAAMAAIDKLCATDIVNHSGTGKVTRGLKAFKQSMSELYNGFPDIHFTIDDMFVEWEKVAVRFTITGTHKGEFSGIPPTKKRATIWGIYIDRIANGKFVESWTRYDTLGFMQQLGQVSTQRKGRK